ncbi:hypothetical protein SDC9_93408 [bioreactor metagenome]|uniref:Uncharacterized protein n=1 Tax=bioreactor metagenome TaxID=1076179 RepID=A0A645A0Y9_9ZZZZ
MLFVVVLKLVNHNVLVRLLVVSAQILVPLENVYGKRGDIGKGQHPALPFLLLIRGNILVHEVKDSLKFRFTQQNGKGDAEFLSQLHQHIKGVLDV